MIEMLPRLDGASLLNRWESQVRASATQISDMDWYNMVEEVHRGDSCVIIPNDESFKWILVVAVVRDELFISLAYARRPSGLVPSIRKVIKRLYSYIRFSTVSLVTHNERLIPILERFSMSYSSDTDSWSVPIEELFDGWSEETKADRARARAC